jgi:hypothetical protein
MKILLYQLTIVILLTGYQIQAYGQNDTAYSENNVGNYSKGKQNPTSSDSIRLGNKKHVCFYLTSHR